MDGRCREVKARVLREDRRLEFLQGPPGVDPHFFGEDPAGTPIGIQGFCLPTRPVQAQHQLSVQTLAQGIPGHQGIQLAHQRRVPSQQHVSVDSGGQDAEPRFLQSGDLGLPERHAGELGQRRTPPQIHGRGQ